MSSVYPLLVIGIAVLRWFMLALSLLMTAFWTTRGFKLRRMSGFKFYLVGSLLQGAPYLLAVAVLLLLPIFSSWAGSALSTWVEFIILDFTIGGPFILSFLIGLWQGRREYKFSIAHPTEWREWLNKAKQARQEGLLNRILLRGVAA